MGKTRLDLARKEIAGFLEDSGQTVFSLRDLGEIYRENSQAWRLAMSTSRSSFADYLCQKRILQKIDIPFGEKKVFTRYALRGRFARVEVYLSLVASAYLSHYTAMGYHQLTEQMPKTYYVNHELTPKHITPNQLTQEGIDVAFAKAPRVSRTVAEYKGDRIVLLNSKSANGLGIIEEPWERGFVRMTNPERTLIDCMVKPEYAGGVYEVAKAFKLANGRASTNTMYAMLKKLDYVYPYHQVLGFYLELAKFDSVILKRLAAMPMPHDFYLTHGMVDPDYSEKWKLYYPKSFF